MAVEVLVVQFSCPVHCNEVNITSVESYRLCAVKEAIKWLQSRSAQLAAK